MTEIKNRKLSLLVSLARVGAVLVALSVFGCYVYDAQQRADARMQAADPAGGGAVGGVGEVDGEAAGKGEMGAALPSSKVLVIDPTDGMLSSSKFATIVPATEFEMLPSTKGMVIDPASLLSSSKSAVIVDSEGTKADAAKAPPALLPSSKVHVPNEEKFLFSSKSAAPPTGPVLELMKRAAESTKNQSATQKSAPKK
ncbi:MAG: hypothetical protein NXI31_25215 [bacterium]|nr:hypothetical protein [bacterium]